MPVLESKVNDNLQDVSTSICAKSLVTEEGKPCLRKQVVAPKVGVTRPMHDTMSKPTEDQLLAQLRRRYFSTGWEHKHKLIT
jgi:hypothetical protein